jgi:hypothetical protein
VLHFSPRLTPGANDMSTVRSTFRMSGGLPIAAIATLSFGAFAQGAAELLAIL